MTSIEKLSQQLNKGQAVVLPTETVYGLFAKALEKPSVDLVYDLKKRPRDKAMNLNVTSYEDILHFSKNQPIYLENLVNHFLPGPLTIILQANEKVPVWINSGLDSVGFRLPDHPVTQKLIATHGPLIGPSANKSGEESGKFFKTIMQSFDNQVLGYEDDSFLTGMDSTILDLSSDRAKILRQGAISKEDLLAKVPELNF
ncbi:L-threonylcarbamoyladenylate synthase [Streptococcus halotolerans]|uniref:L-threonylcarbamoyladenylate synthase n=1 Tax=Streptococcus halotolerans TaxID=1814128 RepID=UPI000786A145|nr:L-threonylcarbamoyladenylate synthase [Streptococcus halotolerans]